MHVMVPCRTASQAIARLTGTRLADTVPGLPRESASALLGVVDGLAQALARAEDRVLADLAMGWAAALRRGCAPWAVAAGLDLTARMVPAGVDERRRILWNMGMIALRSGAHGVADLVDAIDAATPCGVLVGRAFDLEPDPAWDADGALDVEIEVTMIPDAEITTAS